MELGLGHPQLPRELGQQGWGAPGVGVWTGLWPGGTLGGQGWRAAFWGIRASVTPGWPEAQRAGGPGRARVETGVPIPGVGPVG